jgi:hypothetical protein
MARIGTLTPVRPSVRRGVQVVDAEADGLLEHCGCLLRGELQEAAAAAHGEDGDRGAGASQDAVGHRARLRGRLCLGVERQRGERGHRADRQAALLQELAARLLLVGHLASSLGG